MDEARSSPSKQVITEALDVSCKPEPVEGLFRREYTVAWLCTRPKPELAEASRTLEILHGCPRDLIPTDDDNTYVYGSINHENIVIACLHLSASRMKSPTRQVESIARNFPNLEIYLLVGTGSGIPRNQPSNNPFQNVLLGDVVIGWSDQIESSPVIPYDLRTPRYGMSGGGPGALLDGRGHGIPDRTLHDILGKLLAKRRFTKKKTAGLFQNLDEDHPGLENDILYESENQHVPGAEDCSRCGDHRLVNRPLRPTKDFVLHKGTILSGSFAMRDAHTRDRLSETFPSALCIEMETSSLGLVNWFPSCLVIRGISDYGDSHRNRMWQKYAAATAAAFAKELLYALYPQYRYRRKVELMPVEILFNEPHDPDPNFTGRKGILEDIETKFGSAPRVALTGVPGIGKSHTALKYSHLFREKYPGSSAIWISSGNEAQFTREYLALATSKLEFKDAMQLPMEEVAWLVKHWLCKTNNSWLIVLDNANFPRSRRRRRSASISTWLSKYLPKEFLCTPGTLQHEKAAKNRPSNPIRRILFTSRYLDSLDGLVDKANNIYAGPSKEKKRSILQRRHFLNTKASISKDQSGSGSEFAGLSQRGLKRILVGRPLGLTLGVEDEDEIPSSPQALNSQSLTVGGVFGRYDSEPGDGLSDIWHANTICLERSTADSRSVDNWDGISQKTCEKLAEILCSDPELRRLYFEALEELGEDNFNKIYDNLLKQFFEDLRREIPSTGVHLQALQFLRRQSEREQVTGWIRKFCGSKGESTLVAQTLELASPGETKPTIFEDLGLVIEFLVKGESFKSLKANLHATLHPPTNIKTALQLGNVELLTVLLGRQFEKVATGDYSWIQELKDGGYSTSEIAKILMEDATDAPWIYFEPRKFSQLETYPKDGVHTPQCVHQCFSDLVGKGKLYKAQDPSAKETDIEGIQELCGLAGISPSSRELEAWNGTITFEKQNSISIVSYEYAAHDGKKWSEALKKIITILSNFCSAASLMQSSGLCCDTFTVLVHPIHRTYDKIETPLVMISCIELSLVVELLADLKQFCIYTDTLGMDQEHGFTLPNTILGFLVSIWDSVDHDLSRGFLLDSPEEILNYLSLTIQFLSLGLLSYNQGHAGSLNPFFLDTPQQRVILTGTKPHGNESRCISLGLTNLTCIGDMIGGPALTFRAHPSVTDAIDFVEEGKFDILATAEDLLDTWGPGDFLAQADSNISPYAIRVCGGIIFSSGSGDGSVFHWSNITPTQPVKIDDTRKVPFDPQARIRIGSPVTVNGSCIIDENECWENSSCAFENLEVRRHHWEYDESQLGIQGGQYVVVQANRIKHKIPGKTWKQEILEQRPHMLVPYLNCLCGLQVSFCTGVARRVTLGQLITDVFLIFVDIFLMRDFLERELNNIISALKTNMLQDFLKTLPPETSEKILDIIQEIVSCLRSTGVDSEKKFLSVAWVRAKNEEPIQCFRIPCDERTNSWAHVLADSEDCATFAYISTNCLITPEVRCKGASPLWHNTSPLLETAVFQCNENPSQPLQPLDGKKTYFFQKMDAPLKVTVSREGSSSNPTLFVTQSKIPARFAKRLGGASRINPWIRIRERQKPFEISAEIVVVLAENKGLRDLFLPSVPTIPPPAVLTAPP
ncbi:hypothetical protein TWF481_006705 [Arthrobotrys musiformis]|uniref:Nucleoside phosphorylase domain-containing protein n=1 Tax=Arthrobotrys musiformis TaxID=47236 RepID=A0AAV9W9A8_9PEZI